MTGPLRQAAPALLALLLLVLAAILVMTRVVDLRTDMAAFLPPGSTPAQTFLIDQLREGPATTLILAGLEGAPEAELAKVSQAMAEALRHEQAFTLVANGAVGLDGSEQAFLMQHRYLLSARTTPDAFTAVALKADLARLLGQLAGSDGMIAARFGLADPVGAFLDVVRTWLAGSDIAMRDGVWFAGGDGPPRALMLMRTAGDGLDIEGQRQAMALVQASFEATHSQARLLLSGPGIFAVQAADAIKGDARFVSIVSSLVVVLFLYWRHRSVLVLIAVAITLGTGALAGALAVQAAFGFVHGITFGFGMTMLGVTADYPLLVIGQRRPEESLLHAARRLWPTLALALGSAILGLVVMLMSSFPGLAQLGLFAIVGVASAGLMTRFVLPHLTSAIHVRDQSAAPFWLRLADLLRRGRFVLLLPLAAAALWLGLQGGPHFSSDLAALSPVPRQAQDLDETLRRQVGAPDVRYLVAVTGATQQDVLLGAERLEGVLGPLVQEGALDSFDLPSRYIPSARMQAARQAALPDEDTLAAALAQARMGLPFKPDAFARFQADVAASRRMAPLTLADVKAPALRARLAPLLVEKKAGWYGLATLGSVHDPAAIAARLRALGDPALTYVDIKGETEGLVRAYMGEALRWLGLGSLLLLVVLALVLRRWQAVSRVAGPAAGAALIALTLPGLLGLEPNLFNLASLLLMVGVSIDYGLFLNRRAAAAPGGTTRGSAEALALGSVLNCAAATLLTFGLLVFCRNPVLSGIGLTVSVGVVSALVLAVAFSPGQRSPA